MDKAISIHRIILYPLDSVIGFLNTYSLYGDLSDPPKNTDNDMHWINLYPGDSSIGFPVTYPLGSNLSDG